MQKNPKPTQNKLPAKPQKPFGLTLACKVAALALHDSVAPASIILGNLLYLQQDTSFPKELDTHYFIVPKKSATDNDRRMITVLLDELRKHPFDVSALLESHIKSGWVTKKAPLKEVFPAPKSKPMTKSHSNKPVAKKVNSEVKAPVVIVKKNKLGI